MPRGKTGPIALTLKVLVLPQRTRKIAIYRLEDPTAPLTQFTQDPAVALPTDAEILATCNDCFEQCGVKFELHPSSGNYQYPYDTRGYSQEKGYSTDLPARTSDGKLDSDERRAFMEEKWEPPIPPATEPIKHDAPIDTLFPVKIGNPDTHVVIIFKESGMPYGEDYPGLMQRGFAGSGVFARNLQQKTQISLVVAHEIGHELGLSKAGVNEDGDDRGGHDQPPYSIPIARDHTNGVAPVHPGNSFVKHKSAPNRALMQAGTPEGTAALFELPWIYGRWIRWEDWKWANERAK